MMYASAGTEWHVCRHRQNCIVMVCEIRVIEWIYEFFIYKRDKVAVLTFHII